MYIVSTAWGVRKLFVRVCGDIAPKCKKPPLSLTRALLSGGAGRNRTGLRMSDPGIKDALARLSRYETPSEFQRSHS